MTGQLWNGTARLTLSDTSRPFNNITFDISALEFNWLKILYFVRWQCCSLSIYGFFVPKFIGWIFRSCENALFENEKKEKKIKILYKNDVGKKKWFDRLEIVSSRKREEKNTQYFIITAHAILWTQHFDEIRLRALNKKLYMAHDFRSVLSRKK